MELASVGARLGQKEQELQGLMGQRQRFREELGEFDRLHKIGMADLEKVHGKVIKQLKAKIWELEKMFERRPIKTKDFLHIQDLEK